MQIKAIIILIMIAGIIYAAWLFRFRLTNIFIGIFQRIIKFLLAVKTKHQLETLRDAIHDADKNKGKTGRKNIVIYNSTTKTFETVQKKQLKQLNQMQKKKKQARTVNPDRIHHIEKKSLYVTK